MLIKAQFPEKAKPIFTSAPYKVLYGGRGAAKSWSIARALLILGSHKKLFIVCAREIQRSIKDSVHKLLSDQVIALCFHAHKDDKGKDVPAFYEVLDTEIRGINGTTFVFIGLNNITSVKSMEGIDILWVTEAVHVPKSKWEVLLPTVRRDAPHGPFRQGSEVWIDFNPEISTDDTYKMFVVDPPDDAVLIEMNYIDNPFFPQTSKQQMEELRKKNFDDYLNIWLGKTRKTLSGAIYARELSAAVEDGRIGPSVRYDPRRPVIVSFDLGDEDMTAFWVWQQLGNEHNAVFYYEQNGEDITHFLRILQDKKYMVKGIWLPHDARQSHQSARKLVHNTIEKQVKAVYPTPGIVKIVPQTSKVTRINAARALFPRVNINDATCDKGVQCLQHYQYAVEKVSDDREERSKEPLHNWASHGADAFSYYAVQLREGTQREREEATGEYAESKFAESHSQGWMQ